MGTGSWQETIDRMVAELRTGSPRAQAYWAEQLAFAPVLVHALALWLRDQCPGEGDRQAVEAALHLALGGLGPLPADPGIDPALLGILAQRQPRAVGWGRTRTLYSLLRRLDGEDSGQAVADATRRLIRPYPLLGWAPGQQFPA